MSAHSAASNRSIVPRPVSAPGSARVPSRAHPEHRQPETRHACRHAARLAAAHYKVTLGEIFARVRSRRITRARHVAMYLANVVFGLSLTAVAEGFGRDRKTIVYAVRLIEDGRDNPAFDAALANLEVVATALIEQEKVAA